MKFRTRKLIKPEDLNARGTLFGGQMLKWIDEEAGREAGHCMAWREKKKSLRGRGEGEFLFKPLSGLVVVYHAIKVWFSIRWITQKTLRWSLRLNPFNQRI